MFGLYIIIFYRCQHKNIKKLKKFKKIKLRPKKMQLLLYRVREKSQNRHYEEAYSGRSNLY